jgi:hypothetical protein
VDAGRRLLAPGGRRLLEPLTLASAILALATRVAVASGAAAAWLTAALIITALLAALTAVLRAGRWLDGFRLVLVLLALFRLPDVYPKLGGDGYEYYVLARSAMFDRDLDLANDFAGLGARAVVSPRGEVTSRTPLGVGLVWAPAILLAHAGTLVARALGADLPADGFSAPYQAAATTATFVCAMLAVFLVEGLVRRNYSAKVALLVAVALWFGTPLDFYAVANPFMSHGVSAGAAALFVVLWRLWRESTERRHWLVLGLVGGLMTVVRVQDGVLLALPVLDVLQDRGRRALPAVAALAAGLVPAAVLQAAVWARLWGSDFVRQIGTQGPGFTLRLHVAEVLFSPRHGLFTWTPLWAVAVVGFLLWVRRERRLAGLMVLAFALAVAVNASMGDWWGSHGFGQRRLLGLTALFALGLAEVVAVLRARPLVPVAALLGALVLWNVQFAAIYNRRLVAPKDQPITLDRLAAAQADLLYRDLLEWHDRVPRGLWVVAYDNLKGIWIDEGRSMKGVVDLGQDNRDLPFLVAEGWLAPESDGDVRFRRARGKRAFLRVPVRTPGEFRVVARARSLAGDRPVPIGLDVNGTLAGQATAPPSWSDLEFEVPRSAVVPGINLLLLTATPPAEEPATGRRGPGTLFAVASLRFERLGAEEEPAAEPSPSEEPREEPGANEGSPAADGAVEK